MREELTDCQEPRWSVSTFRGECTTGHSCGQPSGLSHPGSCGFPLSVSWCPPENWTRRSAQRWPQVVTAAQLTAAKREMNPTSTERWSGDKRAPSTPWVLPGHAKLAALAAMWGNPETDASDRRRTPQPCVLRRHSHKTSRAGTLHRRDQTRCCPGWGGGGG